MLIFALTLLVLLALMLLLFCADFHSMGRCFGYESVGKVLTFTVTFTYKIDIIGNRGLRVGLPQMEMDVWWSCSVSSMIFSMKKLNSRPEKTRGLINVEQR